jgi:hypothetical protein
VAFPGLKGRAARHVALLSDNLLQPMSVTLRTQVPSEGLPAADPKPYGQQLPPSGLMTQLCCDTGEPQRSCAPLASSPRPVVRRHPRNPLTASVDFSPIQTSPDGAFPSRNRVTCISSCGVLRSGPWPLVRQGCRPAQTPRSVYPSQPPPSSRSHYKLW